jgi:hypothetical protein
MSSSLLTACRDTRPWRRPEPDLCFVRATGGLTTRTRPYGRWSSTPQLPGPPAAHGHSRLGRRFDMPPVQRSELGPSALVRPWQADHAGRASAHVDPVPAAVWGVSWHGPPSPAPDSKRSGSRAGVPLTSSICGAPGHEPSIAACRLWNHEDFSLNEANSAGRRAGADMPTLYWIRSTRWKNAEPTAGHFSRHGQRRAT